MARYALIYSGRVRNVVIADADWPGLADADQAVALADGQACAVGYTYDGSAFTPPGPDLDALRAAHWEAIKAERDRRTLSGGYVVSVEGNPKWFHSDLLSRSQQIGLVLLGAGIPPGLAWKTMDGSFVSMTQALAGAIFGAAAQQDQATFAAAEAARTVMDADPQSFDLASVVWPATYGGAL